MSRTARVVLPNIPVHITQRGHNHGSVFVESRDYQFYLRTLFEWKSRLGVKVYGYCLMTNHVHLLLEPSEDTDAIGLLMKRLAGRQARLANRLEERSGSLWEGRYRSSLVQTDAYLLACSRYIDLNPVRAGIVAVPEDYLWSSFRLKTDTSGPGWLDVDPCFEMLGSTHAERAREYSRFVMSSVPAEEAELIRTAVRRNQLTGNTRFVDEIEQRLGRRIERRGRGRPRKLLEKRKK